MKPETDGIIMSIERRLLSTGQTDRRAADGHPTVT